MIALEDRLLEIQNSARSLIAGRVLTTLPIGRSTSTLLSIRAGFHLACDVVVVALGDRVPNRRHI